MGSPCGSGVSLWVWGPHVGLGSSVGLGSMGGVIVVPIWVWGPNVGLGSMGGG